MFKYNSNDEKEFKKIHSTHLLENYKSVSLNDEVFPVQFAQLYKLKMYTSAKKNKLVLPEEIRGQDLGKIRKVSKWDTKNKRKPISDEQVKQVSGTFSCNNCFRYMIPGKNSTIKLEENNILVQKCNYCAYELKRSFQLPELREPKNKSSESAITADNKMTKKQKLKNKNKLIIQQRMKQKETASKSSSMNLMDFLK